ncbi:MAG TPA: DUF3179 domain-containing protein [Thermoanaerobaculia bacterium]|nr:DUF3179 domain-containing protein [Thermoanaerobaculia bacterium]
MSRRSPFPLLRAGRAILLAPFLLLLPGLDAGAAAGPASPSKPALSSEDGYGLLRRLVAGPAAERRAAARALAESRDPSLVPGLIDAYFFLPRGERAAALAALATLTGERPGERYHDWVELVERRQDLTAKPGYLKFKGELLARIDPGFAALLYEGAPARIRPEEIVFGGVPPEGIPALDRPAHVPAAAAAYLTGTERVFGVSVRGEARAYPLRILDWHEMVNDVLGGEPVTLSYCTLCGSGVLYATRGPAGEAYTFGTSGLLYRSNKLMMDRQTRTLWGNLTGVPVLGRLAAGTARLTLLPVVVTTWKEWLARHPETSVLALDREMERRWGYRYLPGAAEQRRAGVAFPVWPKSGALDPKAEVYAVRLGERAKAYPVQRALAERVINDRLGEEPLVVVADPGSGAVRAYRRGGRTFAPRPGGAAGELVDGEGRRWTAGEETLAPAAPDPEAPALERLPGHVSFWLGWYAFFPHSELYGAAVPGVP